MSNFSKAWFKAAGIRAVKTFAQTAAAMIGVSAASGGPDWAAVIYTASVSGILSLLTSVAGLPEITYREESSDEKRD